MFEVDSLRALRSYLLKYPNIQHDHTSYIDPEGRRAFQLWMIDFNNGNDCFDRTKTDNKQQQILFINHISQNGV